MTYYQGLFRWLGGYDTRLIPKEAGFRWNQEVKQWQTAKHSVAEKLKQYADASAKAELNSWRQGQQSQIKASQATNANIHVPAPDGLSYLGYQVAGIAYAIERDGTLIADEMGLGKTIQAIGVANYYGRDTRTILVICPATLKTNWSRELDKWLVEPLTIGVVDGKDGWPETDAVVINYDQLQKYRRELRSRNWDLLIVDEAHYIKNPDAKRTQEVLGKRTWDPDLRQWTVHLDPIPARKRVLLTGTPIYNRPQDLWTIVDLCLMNKPTFQRYEWFQGKTKFWTRYAGYQKGKYGYEFSGAQNLDELQQALRTYIMIRRLKSQVLTELPSKIRQVIEIDASNAAEVIHAEYEHAKKKQDALLEVQAEMELAKASGDVEAYREAVKQLRKAQSVAFSEMSRIRHQVGIATAKAALPYIQDAVENSGKIVIFAHHQDVVDLIVDSLRESGHKVVKLVGGMSTSEKQNAVDSFQNDADVRAFVGSLTAAGVGITLTASSHVIFVELDWVPANIEQAEDRCHRIGQTLPVLVQHLVLEGSLTARIAQAIVEKQETNRKALDNRAIGTEDAPEYLDEPFTPAALVKTQHSPSSASVLLTPRQRIDQEAESLTPVQVSILLRIVRFLASQCDRAKNLDDCGFNKLDALVGHKLAQTPEGDWNPRKAALTKVICRKYRRQIIDGLGSQVYEEIYGLGSAEGKVRKRNPQDMLDDLDSLEMMRSL